ncbi:MAG TPA: YceI family protein [Solirubrobacteraceae bacterium]|jgi:polyisoprenoid-binding protein YceI|nr:YceI family protein [Solirubrobacteraceae bacterium]
MSTATAENITAESTTVGSAGSVAAGNWKIDTVHSTVGFAVRHMVVATFRGRFERYDGELVVGEDGAPVLRGGVDVDSIVVKDESLAGHLGSPDFFDSERHPRITFSSTGITVGEDGRIEVEGELTIKGHTHGVTARGSIAGPHVDIAGNEKLGVELEAVIDRREYGLQWNAPLPKGGFALENEVKLEVSLELVREA